MKDQIEIKIKHNGETAIVLVSDYVAVKTKDLIEFGFASLTEQELSEALNRVVNNEPALGIIDHFVKDDLVLPTPPKVAL